MLELQITIPVYDGSKLDAELRSALGSKYDGFSAYGPDRPIILYLADDAGKADEDQAAAVCAAHDPTPIPVKDADVTAALAAVPATEIADWLAKQDIAPETLTSALLVRLVALEKRVSVLDGKG